MNTNSLYLTYAAWIKNSMFSYYNNILNGTIYYTLDKYITQLQNINNYKKKINSFFNVSKECSIFFYSMTK